MFVVTVNVAILERNFFACVTLCIILLYFLHFRIVLYFINSSILYIFVHISFICLKQIFIFISKPKVYLCFIFDAISLTHNHVWSLSLKCKYSVCYVST